MTGAVPEVTPPAPGRAATSERQMAVPLDDIVAVLRDPRSYDGVVVGARVVRWFDARWPEAATTLHHTLGFGPLSLRDRTTVLRDDLPGELELAAGVRPLGVLRVVFRLRAEGSGTHVTMQEGPLSGPLGMLWSPVLAAATVTRNGWVLGRLERKAADRARVRRLDDHPPAEGRGRSRSAGHRSGRTSHRRPPGSSGPRTTAPRTAGPPGGRGPG